MTEPWQLLYAFHVHAVRHLNLLKKCRGELPSEPGRKQLKNWLGLANEAAGSARVLAWEADNHIQEIEELFGRRPGRDSDETSGDCVGFKGRE